MTETGRDRRKIAGIAATVLVVLLGTVLLWGICTVTWVLPDGGSERGYAFRGSALQGPAVEAGEGWAFTGWQDETGALLLPGEVRAKGDLTLAAVRMPALEREDHPAYLQTLSGTGLFFPEEPLTVAQAETMFRMLISVEWTQPFVSGQPDAPVTAGMLRETLLSLQPAGEDWTAVLPEAEDQVLTRGDTAVIMNHILGREDSQRGTLAGILPDVPAEHPQSDAILEAVCSHTYERTDHGEVWKTAVSLPETEPGLLLLGTKLYCIGEDGYLVRNGEWDGFSFDGNGAYTCGMPELDELVQQVLLEVTDDAMPPMEKLRAAYTYCRDSFTYLRRNYYGFGATGWGEEEAYTMLSTGYGNCYCYAAAFYEMARALGFDAVLYSGTIGTDQDPHGWVEIRQDGQMYVCDPEIEMTYYRDRPDYTPDMFMMPYYIACDWHYAR